MNIEDLTIFTPQMVGVNKDIKDLAYEDLDYDRKCSIQLSGANDGTLYLGKAGCSTHINQDMAYQIAKVLLYYSKYGELPPNFFEKEE
jgi:hypothetical protein